MELLELALSIRKCTGGNSDVVESTSDSEKRGFVDIHNNEPGAKGQGNRHRTQEREPELRKNNMINIDIQR